MKKLKPIFIMTLVSAFAVLTVVNMSLASPKSAGENTLDMLEIMTRAFDESEGGEGGALIYDRDYCECHTGGVILPDWSSFQGMNYKCIGGAKYPTCTSPGCSTGSSCPKKTEEY